MLKDGTLGSLNEGSRFVAAPGSGGEPSKTNPMVGRMAFWADDESCKVNVNTASEPTPWDVPRAAGPEDRNYALYQPTKREYQRFPGHPATTALIASRRSSSWPHRPKFVSGETRDGEQ